MIIKPVEQDLESFYFIDPNRDKAKYGAPDYYGVYESDEHDADEFIGLFYRRQNAELFINYASLHGA